MITVAARLASSSSSSLLIASKRTATASKPFTSIASKTTSHTHFSPPLRFFPSTRPSSFSSSSCVDKTHTTKPATVVAGADHTSRATVARLAAAAPATIFTFPCDKSALQLIYAQHTTAATSSAAARTHEHAFYVHDLGVIDRQYARFRLHLPRVRPFYAVKCNPDAVLLSTLAALGASFDCASAAEVAACRATGRIRDARTQIVFANPIKSPRDLLYARECGVTRMTFDNVDELHKIHEYHPNAELVLRIKADDSGSLMKFGTKFGASVRAIPALLSTVKKLGLRLVGVSFHIGSGCYDAEKYDGAIKLAADVFDKAEEMGLPALTLLDLGGGFPGNPVPHERTPAADGDPNKVTPSFEEFAVVIRRALDHYFGARPDVEIIAEPGRYFATAMSTLFTRVQGKRVEEDEEVNHDAAKTKKVLYYINDGVYGSFNCTVFDHAHPAITTADEYMNDRVSVLELEQQSLLMSAKYRKHSNAMRFVTSAMTVAALARRIVHNAAHSAAPLKNKTHTFGVAAIAPTSSSSSSASYAHARAASTSSSDSDTTYLSTFFGPTCDSMDVIPTSNNSNNTHALRRELFVGDWLVFPSFGAYTAAAASTFNGMDRPLNYYVRSLRTSSLKIA